MHKETLLLFGTRREALLWEAFEAVALVGFLTFRQQEKAIGEPVPLKEEHRLDYLKMLETEFWQDFQHMAKNASLERIAAVHDHWLGVANTLGLEQWRQEQTQAAARGSESEQDKDRHCRQLLLEGVPRPDSWELPAAIEPPVISLPAAVERAAQDIAALKTTRFEAWGREPGSGYGIAIIPGKQDTWERLTSGNRLEVLRHWIDWQGVSQKDRARLISAQVNLRELPPALAAQLTAEAHPAERETKADARRENDSPSRNRLGRGC